MSMDNDDYRPVTADEFLAKLTPDERANVDRRVAEMQLEDLTLRDLRRAMSLTQQALARALDVNQVAISALERRSDMLISTLRSYIEAMGGQLELVARFPGRPDIRIQSLTDHADASDDGAPGAAAPDQGAGRMRA